MESDIRPWGSYDVLLDAEECKVKRINVIPGGRLSLQSHKHREEHWFVVKGTARVQINNNNRMLRSGDCINIPLGAKHRVTNIGEIPLIFIETQTGTYFGEDDITRYEDDYDRT